MKNISTFFSEPLFIKPYHTVAELLEWYQLLKRIQWNLKDLESDNNFLTLNHFLSLLIFMCTAYGWHKKYKQKCSGLDWKWREITLVFLLLATECLSNSIQRPDLDAGNQTTYFLVMLTCRIFKRTCTAGQYWLWWAEPCARRCAELNEYTAVVTEGTDRQPETNKGRKK